MIYGYIRVSTDKQTVENQRYEINHFCERQEILVNKWIEETISGVKKIQELLDKKVSYSAIGRILGVHRLTVSSFVLNKKMINQ